MNILRRFASNASANIMGGIATAVYNLLLPSIVVHKLSAGDFSVWSLGLQVMIYVQVIGFGIQTVLAKFISADNECNDKKSLYLTHLVGKKIVQKLMMLGFFISIILSYIYPFFFSGLQSDKINALRYCVIAFGFSASIQLLALLPMGYFMGIHKNYIHITCQLLGRAFSLGAIFILVKMNFDIQYLAIALSLCLLVYVALLRYILSKQKDISLIFKYEEKEINRREVDIKSQCKLLGIWSICMLLVNGLQTPIVGFYNINDVGVYSLAYTLILVITGLFQSALSPLITNGASLYAKNETSSLNKLLYFSSFGVCILGLILILGVAVFGEFFLKLWIGINKAQDVFDVFLILAVSFIIRNIASPYAMLLIATGKHKNASFPAIIEGVSSIFISLTFGFFYGVKGVAFGVYFSSIIGLFFNYICTRNNLSFLGGNRNRFFVVFFFIPIPIYSLFLLVK